MRLLRRVAARTVDVAWVAALLHDPRGGASYRTGTLPLDLERAHACLDEPYVAVSAVAAQTLRPWEAMRECSWRIEVVAFVEAEALDLADAALERLRADIAAGRTQPGTHRSFPQPDPFGRREQELAWFWRAQFARLDRG